MLPIWKSALPNLFLNLGAVWIQFGAVWINLKTLSVKWRSHCLGLTVLTYCGQFLVVSICQYVTKSISKFRRNVNKILFLRYRRENGGHISRPQCANTLLLKQNSFYFADDILVYIVEFVLLLHMQLSYLKMNLKSWSAKYRPYCLCLDVLTRCGRDKVTPILKTTFSISFVTSGEIWIIYILEMAVMFRLQCFKGETKWCPFQDDTFK